VKYVGRALMTMVINAARINGRPARIEEKRSEAARINDHAARKEEKKIRETAHKEEKKIYLFFFFSIG